jgi:hypothetical protein
MKQDGFQIQSFIILGLYSDLLTVFSTESKIDCKTYLQSHDPCL